MSRSRSNSHSSKSSLKSQQNNCKVYVSNIFKNVQQSQVRAQFQKFGQIKYFVLKKKQNEVTYSFIQYSKPESAKEAVWKMNRTNFYNRTLNVQYGRGGKHQQQHYQNVPVTTTTPHYQKNRSDNYSDFSKNHNYTTNRIDNRNYRSRKYSRSYSPQNQQNQKKYIKRNSPPRYSQYQKTKQRYQDSRYNFERKQQRYNDFSRQGVYSKRNQYANVSRDYKFSTKYDEEKTYQHKNYQNQKKYSRQYDQIRKDKPRMQNQRQSEYNKRKLEAYPKKSEDYNRDRPLRDYRKQSYPLRYNNDDSNYHKEGQRKTYKTTYNHKNIYPSLEQRARDKYKRSRSREKGQQKKQGYRNNYNDSYKRYDQNKSNTRYRDQKKRRQGNSYSLQKGFESKNNYRQTGYKNYENSSYFNDQKYLPRDNYQTKMDKQTYNYKKSQSPQKRKQSNQCKMKFSSQRSSAQKDNGNKLLI